MSALVSMRELDISSSMLWWVEFPENQGENFNHASAAFIKKNPKRWLNSLPMYEFAYMLVASAAASHGGSLDEYFTDLYKVRMNPILKQYYDKLALYRYHRALRMNRSLNLKNLWKDIDLNAEYKEMKKYATQTRKALRGVTNDFIEQRLGIRSAAKPVAETLQETYSADC